MVIAQKTIVKIVLALTLSAITFIMGAASAFAAAQCQAASLQCPVAGGCTVTDSFRRNRVSPVDGIIRNHNGTDFRAADGTQILAAARGTVEESYDSTSFGKTVIIRHADGGATLYAHLKVRGLVKGNQVQIGQVIGEADSTGRSTGSHLHFEYVPSGAIIQSSGRIDAEPCIGSISVRFRFEAPVGYEGTSISRDFYITIDGSLVGRALSGAPAAHPTVANVLAQNLTTGNHIVGVTLNSSIAEEVFKLSSQTSCFFFKDSDGTLKTEIGSAVRGSVIDFQKILDGQVENEFTVKFTTTIGALTASNVCSP